MVGVGRRAVARAAPLTDGAPVLRRTNLRANARPSGHASRMTIIVCLMLVALALAAVAVVVRALGARRAGPDHDDDRGGEDGGLRRTPRPPRPPDGGDPDWWPTFEREFAEHVDRLSRRAPTR